MNVLTPLRQTMASSGLSAYILEHFQRIRADLPGLDKKENLTKPLDPTKHPNFVYGLPNPTTAGVFASQKGPQEPQA